VDLTECDALVDETTLTDLSVMSIGCEFSPGLQVGVSENELVSGRNRGCSPTAVVAIHANIRTMRVCADWTVPKTVWTPRGRYVLVVRRRSSADARASIPPLQPMERPAESALEGGGEGHRLASGQMPTCADF